MALTTAFGGSYLDFAEVWPYLQIDNAPSGGDAIRMQRMIDAACLQAQRAANRPITPTQFQERFDGANTSSVMVRYTPFLQLVSCTEWQGFGGPLKLQEMTPENEAGIAIMEGVQINYATGLITRVFGNGWPRLFFPGSRNIEVVYMAGFNPVPPDLWMATADLVAYWWRQSQESPRWFGKEADQYGGAPTSALYPGIPNRIAEVFASYRTPSIG